MVPPLSLVPLRYAEVTPLKQYCRSCTPRPSCRCDSRVTWSLSRYRPEGVVLRDRVPSNLDCFYPFDRFYVLLCTSIHTSAPRSHTCREISPLAWAFRRCSSASWISGIVRLQRVTFVYWFNRMDFDGVFQRMQACSSLSR